MAATKLTADKQNRLKQIADEHRYLAHLFENVADQQKQEIFDRIQALKDERVAILGE